MVCVPCFIVPVLLVLWRFILWPLIRPLYVRWYGKDEDKKLNVEKLDKLGEDDCPFGCPLKPKNKTLPESEEKKVL